MIERPWLPDHPVGPELARELIDGQFPDCAATPLERVGEGWDCDVWRCGELCFRFPRRAQAIATLESELAVLPWLAPRLPVAIPRPSRIGRGSAAFRAPF